MKIWLKQNYQQLSLIIVEYWASAKTRWYKLQTREQKFLLGGGILLGLMIVYGLILFLLGSAQTLKQQANDWQYYAVRADALRFRYKEIQAQQANSVSTFSVEQINNDITQLLDIKNVDVSLENGQLSLKLDSVQFNKLIVFIDYLRKSYGVFVVNGIMTRANPGFVSCNLVFTVNRV